MVNDYGFTRALTTYNMEQLLAVYTYLLKKCRVKPQTVHGWWVLGTLLDEIKKTFEQKSPGISSPRFAWLLENEWVLDGKVDPPVE